MKPESKEITPPERSRTYWFATSDSEFSGVTLEGVKAVAVSDSGTHRVKTSDGKLHIIPTGWLHIEIDADDWTF